ncbi:hypothetical protein BT63DRAFT_114528 [Microthyrium microscopicum]|uniref:Uncharacterized protein n=1 Tax=Microthyrium microscopicum TaxID=703497 RepID=A0A6A6TV09_9PEZI|nr:hypothetical protein BT63DRAFT_114528 [Microthyrium microscopicum]
MASICYAPFSSAFLPKDGAQIFTICQLRRAIQHFLLTTVGGAIVVGGSVPFVLLVHGHFQGAREGLTLIILWQSRGCQKPPEKIILPAPAGPRSSRPNRSLERRAQLESQLTVTANYSDCLIIFYSQIFLKS